MRLSSGFISYVLLQLVSSVFATPVQKLAPRASILPATEDPFYTPPKDLSSYAPGTILRTRHIGELSFSGTIAFKPKASYQLLYRTTDSLGHASATVTTVIIPENANTSRVLSYQYAEDAAWLNCAPSYTLRLGSNPNNVGSGGLENILVIAALQQGWVVIVPDYEGLQSAFTSGLQAGRATLDSVRAALASGYLTGVSPHAEYQMWGYSGGSIASEWAAELQPSYAPELHFTGVALGGLVPNVTSVLYTVNSTPFAGLIPAGILGLASAYPSLSTYVREQLLPANASTFRKASTQCLGADIVQFAGQDMAAYFKDGLAALDSPVSTSVLRTTGQMGLHGTPTMPIYAYKAIGDEITPVADTDALIAKLCAQGANITYVRNAVGEHASEEITGSGAALGFLADRFHGVKSAKGCSTTNVLLDTISGPGVAYLSAEVLGALVAILGLPVGRYIG